MEYVLAKTSSINLDNQWYARNIPTLELAKQQAPQYPDAQYIIEYQEDYASKGILPTGRSWRVNEAPEWDGHTSADVVQRLTDGLANHE